MGALAVPNFTLQEYLAGERVAESPSEYVDGEIFPIEASTEEHGFLVAELCGFFSARLRGGPCRAGGGVHVRVNPRRYLVPDISVICRESTTDEEGYVTSGIKLIVEVLSPSTEGYDRGKKFEFYQSIPTFEEYVLVAQDRVHVDVFTRVPQDGWLMRSYSESNPSVALHSLGIEIPLMEIYAGIVDASAPPV